MLAAFSSIAASSRKGIHRQAQGALRGQAAPQGAAARRPPGAIFVHEKRTRAA